MKLKTILFTALALSPAALLLPSCQSLGPFKEIIQKADFSFTKEVSGVPVTFSLKDGKWTVSAAGPLAGVNASFVKNIGGTEVTFALVNGVWTASGEAVPQVTSE